MQTAVSKLLALGADAMDNLFDVVIDLPDDLTPTGATVGSPNDVLQGQLRLRCQGFTPPHFKVGSYSIRYKTIKVIKPSSVIEGDRTFQLTFRMDANYEAYKALLKWRAKTTVPSTGYATTLPNGSFGEISVTALASAVPISDTGKYSGLTDGEAFAASTEQRAIQWRFLDVWLLELTEPVYNVEGGAPLKVTATFAFGEFQDPGHSWIGAETIGPSVQGGEGPRPGTANIVE